MIQKFREFSQFVRELGWKHLFFTVSVMGLLYLGSHTFGWIGMAILLVLAISALVAWSRGKEIATWTAKKAWVGIVAIATFLVLLMVVSALFKSATLNFVGTVLSVVVSWLVAFWYAGSPRKGRYHAVAIMVCVSYLALYSIGQWGLTPAQLSSGANRNRYVVQSIYDLLNSLKDKLVIIFGRTADDNRLVAKMLDEVTIHTPGLMSDFKDDSGLTITAYRIRQDDILVRFPGEDVKMFDGEDYIKVKVDGDPPILGWFKFRTWHKNLAPKAASAKAKSLPDSRIPPMLPFVPAPATSALDEETVVANKDHWTITKVPVALEEHVWVGPFPSEGDGKRLVVCIDGGQPVAIQPYLWPNGKFGARIHRMSGDHATQYLWLRVSDGAPFTIKLNKNRPY